MAKFTSKDGADSNGIRAEVTVQTGTGHIDEIVESGPNANIKIRSEHLRHPINGWIAKDDPLFAKVVEARDQGREIAYRIENQRKANIDRTIPIDTLRPDMSTANKNCKNIFAGLDGVLSREAVTLPAEDPVGGRVRATAASAAPAPSPGTGGGFLSVEQALDSLAKARQGGLPEGIVNTAAALALAAGASVKQVSEAGVTEQGEAAQPQVRGRVRAAEAAPHVGYNTDGRLNLGSYAVQAAVGAEALAVDLLAENNLKVMEAHNAAVASGEVEDEAMDAPDPVNYRHAAALGLALLDLADRVQVGAYGGGRPDRMANSHTRARGYVYDAVKHRHPVPFGKPAGSDEHEAWKDAIIAEAVERFLNCAEIAITVEEIAAPEAAPQAADGGEGTETQAADGGKGAETGKTETQAAERPRVPVEGDEGFVAPTDEIVQRFRALSLAAGFEATPNNPVSVYLANKFAVSTVRKVHGPALSQMLAWYEQQGEQAAAKFRAHVLAEAGVSEQQSA